MAVSAPSAFAQDQGAVESREAPEVFRSGVDAVVVNVTVRDRRGRIMRDLARADFAVVDSGLQKPIESFYAGTAPISLAILLDISGSMGVGGNMQRAREAVEVGVVPALDDEERAVTRYPLPDE
jgi:hypothetical protein